MPNGLATFLFVRTASGDLAAGGLYLHAGQVWDAYMPAMSSHHSERRPGHLLAWHSLRLARQRGYAIYNWQGSPPESGVARFKAQWGSHEHAYSYVTKVTGDAAPFLAASVAELVAGYPGHFALPFDAVGGTRTDPVRASSRAAAWRALEQDS